jgi:Transposase
MADEHRPWRRQQKAFWRAHHEAWKRSDLNQREYCEAHKIPLKAFGNWRAQFKAEPQPAAPKMLYRRGGSSHGLSHTLSHTLSHSLSHVTKEVASRPIVPAAREGRRRTFSDHDKRRIAEEAMRPDANLSAVARSYGIAARVLFRWKEELTEATAPVFASVEIVDMNSPTEERAP